MSHIPSVELVTAISSAAVQVTLSATAASSSTGSSVDWATSAAHVLLRNVTQLQSSLVRQGCACLEVISASDSCSSQRLQTAKSLPSALYLVNLPGG